MLQRFTIKFRKHLYTFVLSSCSNYMPNTKLCKVLQENVVIDRRAPIKNLPVYHRRNIMICTATLAQGRSQEIWKGVSNRINIKQQCGLTAPDADKSYMHAEADAGFHKGGVSQAEMTDVQS